MSEYTKTDPPAEAARHTAWAQHILADMHEHGVTTDQQLAAANIHAQLAIAARLAELAEAVKAAGNDTRGELADIRAGGLNVAIVAGWPA
jgi:hypothetical protein